MVLGPSPLRFAHKRACARTARRPRIRGSARLPGQIFFAAPRKDSPQMQTLPPNSPPLRILGQKTYGAKKMANRLATLAIFYLATFHPHFRANTADPYNSYRNLSRSPTVRPRGGNAEFWRTPSPRQTLHRIHPRSSIACRFSSDGKSDPCTAFNFARSAASISAVTCACARNRLRRQNRQFLPLHLRAYPPATKELLRPTRRHPASKPPSPASPAAALDATAPPPTHPPREPSPP